jgi:hypothetical protein
MNDLFELALAVARQAAPRYGYELGLHGSGQPELDLIAAPWADNAIPGDMLAERILVALLHDFRYAYVGWEDDRKPHGRVVYTIRLTRDLIVNLSVLPRRPHAETNVRTRERNFLDAQGRAGIPE